MSRAPTPADADRAAHAEAVVCALARLTMPALQRALAKAAAKRTRASEARRALPAGSSRARVTTANARYATACEAYDRIAKVEADVMEIVGRER